MQDECFINELVLPTLNSLLDQIRHMSIKSENEHFCVITTAQGRGHAHDKDTRVFMRKDGTCFMEDVRYEANLNLAAKLIYKELKGQIWEDERIEDETIFKTRLKAKLSEHFKRLVDENFI